MKSKKGPSVRLSSLESTSLSILMAEMQRINMASVITDNILLRTENMYLFVPVTIVVKTLQ